MTAIKHTLQREVFLPSEERLIAVVHVTKEGKKKKASFLCAAVTTEKPVTATIYQVKKQDKGDVFKKKASWPIRQLKVFDAKFTNKEVPEFDVHFDKVYRWVASSITEKNAFILSLWKLSQTYVVQKPEFVNIQPGFLEESIAGTEVEHAVHQTEDIGLVQESDWKALSPKEESDVELMMSQCEYAISNAELFVEQLSKDLSVLDGANIHSIMGSEDQVLELMLLLDTALQQATRIEQKLDEYEQKIQSVKDLMDIMKDKDALINVRNKNHQRLLEELSSLVHKLDLDHSHVKVLLNADLCSQNGIFQCSQAAKALLKCSTADIHPSMEKMTAVQEQQKRFEKLKATFAKQLSHHLNNLFIHQGNEMGGGTLTLYSQELKLPQHTKCHRELLPYSDLMSWLKAVDNDSFLKLRKVYTTSLNKLYDREVKDFMELIKQGISMSRSDRKGSLATGTLGHQGSKSANNSSSSSSLNKSYDSRGRSGSQGVGDVDDSRSPDGESAGRKKFDQMFEHILSELGPWCLAEQDFCVRFFNLTAEDDKSHASSAAVSAAGDESTSDGPWMMMHGSKAQTAKQRQISEEVRQMMGELFPILESELMNFEAFGNALDSMNCLYMLVRMGNHVSKAQDTGSFLSKAYGNCTVQMKRNFDNFIKMQMAAMREFKASKKSKVGVIPFVNSFEDFARQAEGIFKASERRSFLDKAYKDLITVIFSEVKRVSQESQKTPPEVVQFENYHHLFAVLSQLKIVSLETQRKDAKQMYQEWQQAYVTVYLGQPMEKVHIFFDGIESKLAAGIRTEEVGYQLQFSKQELRKVIKEYTGREVKKGLEQLYKRVEKHLCEEENLLQVVWHSMQDEFLKQYKYFESMIGKCYPDSGITFEFSIADLLGYFSDIAQSH